MKQDKNQQQGGWGGQAGKTQQKQPNLGNQPGQDRGQGQQRPGTPSGFGGGKDQNRGDQTRK